MTEKGCALCKKGTPFHLNDDLGGKWTIEGDIIKVTQSYQRYGGGPDQKESRETQINFCPWCGRSLEVAE